MADKSVIQMSAEKHHDDLCAALISALHVHKLQSAIETTADEAAAFAVGFEQGWKFATLNIRREGNSKFEGGL